MRCSVYQCRSSHEKGKKQCRFYAFPLDKAIRKKWKEFCGRPKDFNAANARICTLHFTKNDFERNLQYEMGFCTRNGDKLKPGVVPTITLEQIEKSKCKSRSFQEEYLGTLKRNPTHLKSESRCEKPLPEYGLIPPPALMEVEYTEEPQPESPTLNNILNLAVSNDHQYASKQTLSETKTEKFEIIEKEDNSFSRIQELEQEVDKYKRENFKLKLNEKKLNAEINKLKKLLLNTEKAKNSLESNLRQIFSVGQIKKIKNGAKRQVWSEPDIAQSITWYSASPKTYSFLRKRNFPLPSVRTLQKWAEKIDISSGILEPVLKILKAANHLDESEKMCVLSFDKMKVKKCFSYERNSDTILAPCDFVQVVMLRGLISNWKQPVYYAFDTQMTKDILFEILSRIKACGYITVAVVTKLDESRKFFNEMEIGVDKPWFSFDHKNIYVFPDAPDLMKSLRNQFLDNGFIIHGKEVKKEIIEKLLSLDSPELSKASKICTKHLNVTGVERHKIKWATQLFSNTTSQIILLAASTGFLIDENWIECHQLFKLANDWFDIMNVRNSSKDFGEHTSPYGLSLDIQNNILNEMSELVLNMRVIGNTGLASFQKGIVQGINALRLLFVDLKNRLYVKCIITNRLNQNLLESFFGTMCSSGGSIHDYPSCQQFKSRLKNQILAANCETYDIPEQEEYGPISKSVKKSSESNPDDDDGINEDSALESIAEYICQKLHKEIPDVAVERDETPAWVNYLSESDLKPTEELIEYVRILDDIFIEFNQDKIVTTTNYLKQLLELANDVNCNEIVKKLFFKARMYSRIRILNSDLEQTYIKKKRKYKKNTD